MSDNIKQQEDILTENSFINDISEWVNQVYEIDEQDYVHGGLKGYDNVPHEQLANRTLYLKTTLDALITKVNDFKTEFDNQNTSNLNDFTSLRQSLVTLQNDLNTVQDNVNKNKKITDDEIASIHDDINNIMLLIKNHTHNYAGSDSAGGDANTVKTLSDAVSILSLIGVSNDNQNQLKLDSLITAVGGTLNASTFVGELKGTAESAKHFQTVRTISLYGDVIGSVQFDGNDDAQIKTTLSYTGVKSGTYGPDGDTTLSVDESMIIPELTINPSGVITSAYNRKVKFSDASLGGTTNATQSTGKMFLVSADNQKAKEVTYTNSNAFQVSGVLYSNGKEVVNLNDTQDLSNKTYNGYTLNDACSHGVEKEINGVNNSDKLVTSNSLFNHKHLYAGSNSYGGDANTVNLSLDTTNQGYLVLNDNVSNSLTKNTEISVKGDKLTAGTLSAKNSLYIPGGKLWIDTSVKAMDGSSYTPSLLDDITTLKQEMTSLRDYVERYGSYITHNGTMQSGVTCNAGDLLSYKKGGFVLADNSSEDMTSNICLAIGNSQTNNSVSVLDVGKYELEDSSHDGDICYVGVNGKMIFDISVKPKYVRKVGHVEGNQLIFNDSQITIMS